VIKDFEIENFRQFKSLNLEKLNRVNLFVGKNSAGKSALLEALLLFFSQMSSKYIPLIHLARQEWDDRETQELSPLRHLFHNHKFPESGSPGIKLSCKGDKRSFELQVLAYTKHTDPSTYMSTYKLLEADLLEVDNDLAHQFLVLKKENEYTRIANLSSTLRELERRRIRQSPSEVSSNCQFIPTHGLDDYETAHLWDKISLTPLEQYVIRGIQLIEPKAEAIAFVGSSRRERVPLVKIAGQSEPRPLKSLGDGMRKIFQIILGLANARNGTLLIDEFENGLHWSVQQEVWDLVFELSEALSVQVFATTHSRDCIQGFEFAWAKDASSGTFCRINKGGDGVSLKQYSLGLLQDSLETDVEVR